MANRLPYVYSNFVSSLDGVVSLGVRGHCGGADISGSNDEDRMVMGLLRAVSDVVLIGAGTLRADPLHQWTAEEICPELAADFRALRESLRKPPTPLNIIVSGSGEIDATLPVFSSGRVRALVLTTKAGGRVLASRPGSGVIQAITANGPILSPAMMLREIRQLSAGNHILLEGGPHLLGQFHARRLVDEQFLTVSPQLFGRTECDKRLSMVMGQMFTPGKGRWGRLSGVRRAGGHLFLRYTFQAVLPGSREKRVTVRNGS